MKLRHYDSLQRFVHTSTKTDLHKPCASSFIFAHSVYAMAALVQVEQRARVRRPTDQEEIAALRSRAESAEAKLSDAHNSLQQRTLELVKAQKTLSQTKARADELQREAADKAEETRRVYLRQVCSCTFSAMKTLRVQ